MNYALLLLSTLIISVGQILFKLTAQNLSIRSGADLWTLISENRVSILAIVSALVLYLLATGLWVQALRTTPLSVAIFFNALSFALVSTWGFLFFGEAIPKFFVLGGALIVGGVFLIALG